MPRYPIIRRTKQVVEFTLHPKSYPKFFYTFVIRNSRGKKERIHASAYTDEYAELQANELVRIFRGQLIKIVKGRRINWNNYMENNKNKPAWIDRAVEDYNRHT